MLDLNYSPESVQNLAKIIEKQKEKFNDLRERVKQLKFTPIEPSGSYSPITFKAFDGGMFKLSFDPYQFDIVEIADSNGNHKLRFATPKGKITNEELKSVLVGFEQEPIIKKFVQILGGKSLFDISEVLKDRGSLMEIGEFACIFDKIASCSNEERTIILRDGLLRTKKIKHELIKNLTSKLNETKSYAKLVGVSKTSSIVSLLHAAILCEKVFPEDHVGYVEIPSELENMAYIWSGKGKLIPGKEKRISYAFGRLYIAKLSRSRNLFVTIEIPRDMENDKEIYSKEEIMEIMNYIAKDSTHSYPIMGYPQTIMRAHEFAVRLGLPASILRDKIIEDITSGSEPTLKEFIRDGIMIREDVDKGVLGGNV